MTKKSDPAHDETLVAAAGDDTVSGGHSADHIERCEALGLNPDEVQADDPVLTGVSRDESDASIDPHTGLKPA